MPSIRSTLILFVLTAFPGVAAYVAARPPDTDMSASSAAWQADRAFSSDPDGQLATDGPVVTSMVLTPERGVAVGTEPECGGPRTAVGAGV